MAHGVGSGNEHYLMMKMYDFFIRLSRLVAQYNNVKKSSRRWNIFYIWSHQNITIFIICDDPTVHLLK